MNTVLAVDDYDVAFLFALAVALKRFDIWLIPADSVEQARLLYEHMGSKLDLLLINCSVRRVCQFAAMMARRVPGLKIVGVTRERHTCGACRKLLSTMLRDQRPRRQDMIQQWMSTIRSVTQQDAPPGGPGNC
jgi:hypothetical protein